MKVASPPEQITRRPARVAVEDPPAGRGSQVHLQVRPTVRAKCRIIPLAPPNRQPRERKTQNAIAMMPQKTNRKGVIPSGWKEEQSRPGMGECDRSGRTRRGIHASAMCAYYLTAACPTIRISLTQHFTSVNAEPWRDALTNGARLVKAWTTKSGMRPPRASMSYKAPTATANRHVHYHETLRQRKTDCSQQCADYTGCE
jgi:hypothetical protein